MITWSMHITKIQKNNNDLFGHNLVALHHKSLLVKSPLYLSTAHPQLYHFWTKDMVKVWVSLLRMTLSPWQVAQAIIPETLTTAKTAKWLGVVPKHLGIYLNNTAASHWVAYFNPMCVIFRSVIKNIKPSDRSVVIVKYNPNHIGSNRRRIKRWLKKKYTSLLWR